MSIQAVSSSNISKRNMTPQSAEIIRANKTDFEHRKEEPKAPIKVKIGAALGTLTGVSAAMFYVFKSKKFDTGNIREMKGIKDYFYNLIHVKYNVSEEENAIKNVKKFSVKNVINKTKELFNKVINRKNTQETASVPVEKKKKIIGDIEKLIGVLTLGSVGGGLAGGLVTDKKENRKAKFREAIIQVVGNIFAPLLCVDGGLRIFENTLEKPIIKGMEALRKNQQKALSCRIKGAPKALFSMICLVGGLILGNKVGNVINDKMFKVNDKRKIKLADLSPQIDDACVAVSIVASEGEGKLGAVVSRFIPAALMIAGYSTGVMQENPERYKTDAQIAADKKKLEEMEAKSALNIVKL